MIVLCWLLATSVSLPPLFGTWSYYQFHEAQMGCFPMWSVSKSFSAIWVSIRALVIIDLQERAI